MIGSSLNHYQITAKLAAGGMGEVYRARDTRLEREVAIKVLPKEFAGEPTRLKRFEQEAKTLATLSHPNILVIHDVGVHEGTLYLVSELLEGQTLREVLCMTPNAPLPQRKTIEFALQIAQGLAAAHAKGIIHRDLKPENIFVTKDGRVKILDFGLAKLKDPSPTLRAPPPLGGEREGVKGEGVDENAPTLVQSTEPGMVLGTPAYMSPEQVRGEPADHLADIFAFGCVLYEMLSGGRAFPGGSAVEVMNGVLKMEPPEITCNRAVPPSLDRLVRHCLEKDSTDRFQSINDVAFSLDVLSVSSAVSATQSQSTDRSKIYQRLGWVVAVAVSLAALSWLVYRQRLPVDSEVVRFSVMPPEDATNVRDPAISPDGSRLAFVATTEGKTLLWLRPLRSLTAQPLSGTEGASYPFWSPNNQFIGFFAQGKLKKIAISGGPPTTLADAPRGRGATWSRGGVILYTAALTRGLSRVSEAGGDVAEVTVPDRGRNEHTHEYASFLPDGRHFLYFAFGSQTEEIGIYVGSLDNRERQRLASADSGAVYAPPGFLCFVRGATLFAQPFDAAGRRFTGEPFRLADLPQVHVFTDESAFSISENGVLVYGASVRGGSEQLGWFDRAGKPLGLTGSPGSDIRPALSPDGKQVAVSRLDPQTRNADLWLLDLARGTESRFTFDSATDHDPVWSPDGSRIVWNSNREGAANLYQKSADGAGQEELLLKADHWKWANDWSSDGRFILFNENNPKTHNDLWILPLDGERKPFPWLQTPFHEREARFSPDSKWIAYVSNESGNDEVYVRTFPAAGGKWRISTRGGNAPRWRSNGEELFYLAADGTLVAVAVTSRTTFEASVPQTLFDLRSIRGIIRGGHYAMQDDGQRFLIVTSPEQENTEPFTVVLNWTKELKR